MAKNKLFTKFAEFITFLRDSKIERTIKLVNSICEKAEEKIELLSASEKNKIVKKLINRTSLIIALITLGGTICSAILSFLLGQ